MSPRRHRTYLAVGGRGAFVNGSGPEPFAKPELGDHDRAIPRDEVTLDGLSVRVELSSYGDDPDGWLVAVHALTQERADQMWHRIAARMDALMEGVWET